MPGSESQARPKLGWSVRTRILAAILAVTAVGLTVAGFTAYLMQRERILAEIDAKLVHAVDSVRALTLESAETADIVLDTPEDVLEAVLARVLPDRNESSLGIIDGQPRLVSAAAVTFHLEDDQAFIQRVNDEVSDSTVRLGTYLGDRF